MSSKKVPRKFFKKTLPSSEQSGDKEHSETSISPKPQQTRPKFESTEIQTEIFESNLEEQNHLLKLKLQKQTKKIDLLNQKIKSLIESSSQYEKQMRRMNLVLRIYEKGVNQARRNYHTNNEAIVNNNLEDSRSSIIKEEKSAHQLFNQFNYQQEDDSRSFERDEIVRKIMNYQGGVEDIELETDQSLSESQSQNRSVIKTRKRNHDQLKNSKSDISNNYEPISCQPIRQIYEDQQSNYSFRNINMANQRSMNNSQNTNEADSQIKIQADNFSSDDEYRLRDLDSPSEDGELPSYQSHTTSFSKIKQFMRGVECF